MEQSSQEGKIVKATTGTDYLLLHRIRHSNSDSVFILNILLNKNELKSHRLAAAFLHNKGRVLPNEKLGGAVRDENKVGLEWQSVF